MFKSRLARWQTITAGALFTGYAGYYLCRSVLSVAAPLLLSANGSSGMTMADIGAIASAGVFLYAVGKVVNGLLADFCGGRRLFLLGMFISVLCTLLFGLASGLAAFTLLWAANRYVQSMGWGGLVKIAAHWFPVSRQATVMGLLSMSYLLGDALARLFLGTIIQWGVGWRGLFGIAAATLGAIAVGCWWLVQDSPRVIGAPEPEDAPANVFGSAAESGSQPDSVGQVLTLLGRNPSFWTSCVLCAGLTLIRETFTFWVPTYLVQVVGLKDGPAAQWSLLFPLVGAISALLAGWASDRLRGKLGRIAVPSLLVLVGILWLFSAVPLRDDLPLSLTLIGAVAFFLLGPYSFCSGIIPLTLGGKRGSSTAAGLIDSAGYLGGVLSGHGIGSVAQHFGWPAAFQLLSAVAGLSCLAAVVYLWLQEAPASAGRG